MPKKKVIVEGQVIVTDKGTLKKTAKGAHSVDRRLKGAARTSSNTSKNFSKMAQGISGGLVPAYATLAASLFALDAVYRGLKNAADLRILQQGQLAYAQSTGQAMNVVAGAVQRATQMQISFKEASQASAIAAAAGFGTDQIVQLAEAANAAAKVLGRSVPDAFDRMVRGVVKAEPEVLDELGIILRLDDAARRYAEALNIDKNALTTYEKSQAVLNDVLAQAESKFAHVADSIDPNPWNQLGVALEKVKDTFLVFISGILEPVATFLSENAGAAVAAMLIFVSSIMKGLIPSYSEQATAFVASQNAQQLEIDQTIAKIKELKAAKMGQTEKLGMAEGGAQGLARKMAPADKRTTLGKLQQGKVISAKAASKELVRIEKLKNKKIKGLTKQETLDYKTHLQTIVVEQKKSTKKMEFGWKRFTTTINLGSKKVGLTWKTVMRGMQRVTTIASRAMAVAMSAMGWISMIFMAVEAIKSYREANNEAVIAQKEFDAKTKDLAKTYKDLDKTMTAIMNNVEKQKKLWKTTGQEVEYMANALKSLPAQATIDYLKELGDTPITDELLEPISDVLDKMSDLVPVLDDIRDGMSTEEIIKYIEEFKRLNAGMQDFAQASRSLTEAESKFNRAAKERADSLLNNAYRKEMMQLVTIYENNLKLMTVETTTIKDLAAAGELSASEWDIRSKRLIDMVEKNNVTIEQFEILLKIRSSELRLAGQLIIANQELGNVYKWQYDRLRDLQIAQIETDITRKKNEKRIMKEQMGELEGDNLRHIEAQIGMARLDLEVAVFEKRQEYLRRIKDDMVELETTIHTSMAAGLQKGLEQFISLKGDLGDLIVSVGKAISAGMAKKVSEQLTEKIMGGIWGESTEQKIKREHIDDLKGVYKTFDETVDKLEATLKKAGEEALEEANKSLEAQGYTDLPTSISDLSAEITKLIGEGIDIPGITNNTAQLAENTAALRNLTEVTIPEDIAGIQALIRQQNPDAFVDGILQPDKNIKLGGTSITSGRYPDSLSTEFSIAKHFRNIMNPEPETIKKVKKDITDYGFGTKEGISDLDKEALSLRIDVLRLEIEALKANLTGLNRQDPGKREGQRGHTGDLIEEKQKEIEAVQDSTKSFNELSPAMGSFKDAVSGIGSYGGFGKGGTGGFLKALFKGVATGGYVTKKGIKSFAGGGQTGGHYTGKDTIPAMLSPGETILTPKQLRGISGGNTVVNVNMGEGGASVTGQQSDSANSAAFGRAIAGAVNREIGRQKRVGGLLYQ